MTQATFTTPRVSCGSCMATIEDALSEVVGVQDTDVDLIDKQVHVTFDPQVIASEDIAAAITEVGYEVTNVTA